MCAHARVCKKSSEIWMFNNSRGNASLPRSRFASVERRKDRRTTYFPPARGPRLMMLVHAVCVVDHASFPGNDSPGESADAAAAEDAEDAAAVECGEQRRNQHLQRWQGTLIRCTQQKKVSRIVCTGLLGTHPCSACRNAELLSVPLARASKCVRSWCACRAFTIQKR